MGVILYQTLAKHYDKIYEFKDYQQEATELRKVIRKYKRSSSNRLLDVACGTGRHITYLNRYFNCTGMDASRAMLSIARHRNPRVRFYLKDMTDFYLKTEFDVITCLFSSIGHLRTRKKTQRAIFLMSKHLARGGVLVIEPFLQPQEIIDSYPHLTFYQDDDLKIARLSHTRVRKRVAVLDFHYAISERGKGLSSYEERIEMALLNEQEWLEIATNAGFDAIYEKAKTKMSRGMLIGIKA